MPVPEVPAAEVQTTDSASSKRISVKSPAMWGRFKVWYIGNKKFSIPLSVAVLVLVLFAIPFTRYAIAGTFIKKDISVAVTDSKTGGVVSSARVEVGENSAETNGQGIAVVKNVPLGKQHIRVYKQYYKDADSKSIVGLSSDQLFNIKTEATGRPSKVHIVSSITGKALAEVALSDGQNNLAKTDKNGDATVVLAVGTQEKKLSLLLNGFNSAEVDVKASDNKILKNDFSLTPQGKIYFLSKLSGKIDLVKTNLDGTARETVLAGTGKEDDVGTVLLVSRDWKYLALLSRRDSGLPRLYLVETENDKLTTMDEGNASFSLVGWEGSTFVYQATRNTYSDWQPKKNIIKSFNADSKQITVLSQTDAIGDSNTYAQEQFGNAIGLTDGTIVYTKIWYSYPYDSEAQLVGKQNGIYSIRADGSGKKTLKTISAQENGYINTTPGKPNQLYFYYYNNASNEPTYLEYVDGAISEIQESEFPTDGIYNTYLLSPSGKQNFWSEQRDGKNNLLVGDSEGNDGKTVARSENFQTYGWFTEKYLLVSKNSSELYIMSADGLSDGQLPLKISDYHKPAQSYFGYGGGYGGI